MLERAEPGATVLLDAPYGPESVWEHLPHAVRTQIIEKRLALWVVDAHDVAERAGLGGRTNTIMQTCFFAISGVLPREQAIEKIRGAILKTYGGKGEDVVGKWFGVITAGFLVGAATGGVLFGWLGDKVGRVRAMTLSVVVYAGCSGLCAFASTPWELAGLRFAGALGMGSLLVSMGISRPAIQSPQNPWLRT